MNLTVTLDILVAVLLVATIVYALLLSRRLGALRNDKEQLVALIRSLDESARRAENGIAGLRNAADEIGQQLQKRLDQGESLRTDLSYIVELGSGLADRLETAIRSNREDAKPSTARGAGAEPAPKAPRRSAAATVATQAANADAAAPTPGDAERVTGFPSRAERLLRRALEMRR
jgi:Domain of unknown function (DUF6468)